MFKIFDKIRKPSPSSRVSSDMVYHVSNDELLSKTTQEQYDTFLMVLEPISHTITLGQNKIVIEEIQGDGNIIHGYTEGSPMNPLGNTIYIDPNYPNVLVHEFGHIIDKYSDGLPYSYKPEFRGILPTYWNHLDALDIDEYDKYRLYEPAEAFAVLFEQYCKEVYADISITQEPTDNSEYFSEFYKENNIKQYFDNTLSFLHYKPVTLTESLETLENQLNL